MPSVDYPNVSGTEFYHLVEVTKAVEKLRSPPCNYEGTNVMILSVFQM